MSTKEYTGTIIKESLKNPSVLSSLDVINVTERGGWHIYTVRVSKAAALSLVRAIAGGPWYMHFWKGSHIVAVFKGKVFEFEYDKKDTWTDAVNHGVQIGIPKEQLDFVIEDLH